MEGVVLILILILILNMTMNKSRQSGSSDSTPMPMGCSVLLLGAFICVVLFCSALFYDLFMPGNCITDAGDFPWKKEERKFGIKLVPFGGGGDTYSLVSTNNGFITTKSVQTVYDFNGRLGDWFGDKSSAVKMAKQFKDYDQVLLNNEHAKEKYYGSRQSILVE